MKILQTSYRINTNRFTLFSMIVLFTVILSSCIVENDREETDDEFFIDQETATIVAENLLFPETSDVASEAVKLRVSDYNQSKTVNSIEPLTNKDGENVMYIVNYVERGFVILSADRRMDPILAHSIKNSFDTKQSLYNPGLVAWIDEFSSIISSIRQSDKETSGISEKLWDSYITEQLDLMALGTDLICDSSSYTRTIGPLLNTQWGQSCGYNANLPVSGCGINCDRALTGCVATAMAQILKYHADRSWHGNYRNSNNAIVLPLDWSGMPLLNVNSSPGSDVPTLMDDIGQITDMNYTCEEGSSSHISDAHSAFVDNFNFRTALRHDLDDISDYELILEEIDLNRPVYIRGQNTKDEDESFSWLFPTYGDGHAWVADGYSYNVNCDTGNSISNSYRIHMNWGWSGNADGEYLKKSNDFPNHREIIYNLVPPPSH